MIKVLVVDDSALLRKLLSQVFEAAGDFVVETARNGVEALQKIGIFNPDVVTLDVTMPEMDGIACLDRIMVEHPCPVVMVSSLTAQSAEATLSALELGAIDFVPKPKGAVSLQLDEFGPLVLEKVRGAAAVGVRKSRRLSDRLRFRAAGGAGAVEKPRLSIRARHGLVLVGCSTGGPPALDALLSPLPADFPWPIVIAQHMPASFTGALARRLDGICALRVSEVAKPTRLQPGNAYVGKGDADLLVTSRAGALVALSAPSQPSYRWHPSVDRLVDSAMQYIDAAQVIGILMTGMGDDGAAAMATLHAAGGHTLAEAEASAVVWGMPGALLERGGASETVPLDRLAGRLLDAVR